MHFLQLIDYFVGGDLKQDNDTHQKTRLLVGAILSFQISALAFAPIYFLIPGIAGGAKYAYLFISLPAILFWVFLLKITKAGKNYLFVANSVIASTSAVLYSGVIVTGGPFSTEVHPLLIVLVLFAFLLIGKRGGLIWTLLLLTLYFLLVGMSLSGVTFINLPPEEVRGILRVFNWTLAFMVVAALSLIHDSLTSKVIFQRNVEREKFKTIAKVAIDTSVVNRSADSLAQSSDGLLAAAIQQKTAIEELAVTTDELSATAQQNSDLSASAKVAIKETEEHLKISKADIVQLVQSMHLMRHSSEEIQMINNVINDISYQTNILSLNAMIEASRSSEASGGFKVVALEVKRLAERSTKAAENINQLLEANMLSVQQGVALSETMQKRFEEISQRILPLSLSIQNVADASFEQSESIRQITLGLNNIDRAIAENQQLALASSDTAKELHQSALSLTSVVGSMGVQL